MEYKYQVGKRILHLSLTKINIGFIVCVGVVSFAQMGLKNIVEPINMDDEYKKLLISLVLAILAILSYTMLYKFYEKKNITELSTLGLSKNISLGLIIGMLLQSLTIFTIYLNGGFSIIAVNSFIYLLPALTMGFNSAIFEEIVFRGIIFRLIEEKFGTYIALVFSGFMFGAMHLMNPNCSILAAFGLSIQAGILLGAAYVYTKNLWFPIALHFAWNFTQSGIFGASTSGRSITKSLLTTKIEGADIISGGVFGPEGSIQSGIFCLIAAFILLVLSHRHNKIINPYWAK